MNWAHVPVSEILVLAGQCRWPRGVALVTT